MEVGGCETAFYDAQVVADGSGNLFVGLDEALGDDEGEFWVGFGEVDGACCKGWDERDEECRPAERED